MRMTAELARRVLDDLRIEQGRSLNDGSQLTTHHIANRYTNISIASSKYGEMLVISTARQNGSIISTTSLQMDVVESIEGDFGGIYIRLKNGVFICIPKN